MVWEDIDRHAWHYRPYTIVIIESREVGKNDEYLTITNIGKNDAMRHLTQNKGYHYFRK